MNGRFTTGRRGKRQRGGGRGRGRGKPRSAAVHADSDDPMNYHTPSTFDDVASTRDMDTATVPTPTQKPKVDEKAGVAPPSPRITRRQKRLSGDSDAQIASSQDSSAQYAPLKVTTRNHCADSDVTAVNEQTVSQAMLGSPTFGQGFVHPWPWRCLPFALTIESKRLRQHADHTLLPDHDFLQTQERPKS